MKRLIFILTVAIFLTSNVYAENPNPTSKSIALNATTFTAITIDPNSTGRDIGVATSDSSAWIFSDDAAGTVPITIPAPGTASWGCRKSDNNGVLFWAKASAGTPSLSVLVAPCYK